MNLTKPKNLMSILLCIGVLIAAGYLGYLACQRKVFREGFDEEMLLEGFDVPSPAEGTMVSSEEASMGEANVNASEPLGDNEQNAALGQADSTTLNQLPSECYPKDVLSSSDLLPRDANSLYAQVNPSGQGSLQDQNFLTAGYHIGVNTVGQSLRNANRGLRSEPPNPQVKVSPWQQSTIEPDINRRPLEIIGEA